MRVYIAAPWVRRTEAVEIGKRFVASGFEVTSRWFEHPGNPNDSTGKSSPLETVVQQANEDIEDILRADALVVVNLERSEGKAVETGIAIANGIPVVSVGARSNIFQALGKEVGTVDEAISYLEAQR